MEMNYRSGSASALWKTGIQPVYLFFGEEDRLKQEALNALLAHIVPSDFADFDLDRQDTATTTADAILASANQAAFGGEWRVVVVKGMEQWRDRGKQGEVERLAEGLPKLGKTSCLILIAAAEEDEGQRKTGVAVKLDNAIKKIGAIVTFQALKGEALTEWVRERAQHYGKTMQGEAANQLIQSAGHEMLMLENEIIKLTCFAGERPAITARDVGAVVASSPDDVIFSTVDAIARRDTERALALLSELHRYDPKPQAVAGKLLALLARQYRMLWQAKFLAGKRINPRDVRALPPEISSELPTEGNIAGMAFRAGELFTQSKNYAWAELTFALDRLLLCDLANKGGATDEIGTFGADPVGNLQLLVIELTGAAGKRG